MLLISHPSWITFPDLGAQNKLVHRLCKCHVEAHSMLTAVSLLLLVLWDDSQSDGQANRYFDFGHWIFSYRRSIDNGGGL